MLLIFTNSTNTHTTKCVPIGHFLCEAALWTKWQNDGDLEAKKDSHIVSVVHSELKEAAIVTLCGIVPVGMRDVVIVAYV